MDLTLTYKEAAAIISFLAKKDPSLITLRLKAANLQSLLSSYDSPLIELKELESRIQKLLKTESCFPTSVNDVNLEIFSYLDAPSLCKLSLTSKEIRKLSTEQNIWRQRISKSFGVDVGPNSGVFNLSFFNGLGLSLPLITAIQARYINMIGVFWPSSDEYEVLMRHETFRSLVKKAVKENDIELIISLIREDVCKADEINKTLDHKSAPSLVIAPNPDGDGPSSVIETAIYEPENKSFALIAIFKELYQLGEHDGYLVKALSLFKKFLLISSQKIVDVFIDVFKALSDLMMPLLPAIFRKDLSQEHIKEILSPEILKCCASSILMDIIKSSEDKEHYKYLISHISSCPISDKLLPLMISGNRNIASIVKFAREGAKHFDICLPKNLKLCLEGKVKIRLVRLILSYATVDKVSWIAQMAKDHDLIEEVSQWLPDYRDIQDTYLNKFSNEEVRELFPKGRD